MRRRRRRRCPRRGPRKRPGPGMVAWGGAEGERPPGWRVGEGRRAAARLRGLRRRGRGPEPAALLRGLLPAAPPLRLRPPGYVTRDLPFPLRHGAATPALPPARRRPTPPGRPRPCFRVPPSPAPQLTLSLRRRVAGHSFTRAFECSLHQRLQNGHGRPGPGLGSLLGSGAPPSLPRSQASRRRYPEAVFSSLISPPPFLFICLYRFQDTCPQVSLQVLPSHLYVLLE